MLIHKINKMKILIQAGHKGRTSGATGAPEEQKWTTDIAPKIASKLGEHGFETRVIGADPTEVEIAGDWDLFLAVHYDADIYKDRGGFIDTPDPSVDNASEESTRIANEMRRVYFDITGIPNRPDRSNVKTRFYYMWKKMSKKTPCVIIEAGVGYRTPEDHKTLWFQQERVVDGITRGILNALKPEPVEPPVNNCEECEKMVEKLGERVAELEMTVIRHEKVLQQNPPLLVEIQTTHIDNGDKMVNKYPIGESIS